MSKEIWKIIEGYPNYMISDKGRVMNINRSKIMKNKLDKDGYVIVGLSKNNLQSMKKVHRLVGFAFIPNPDNLPQMNHKDKVRANNFVSNLEWCTLAYNVAYSSAKDYTFLNPEGSIIHIHNLNKYCRDNNLLQANMARVHSGQQGVHKGWRRVI